VYASTNPSGPFYLQGGTLVGNSFNLPYPLVTGSATPPLINTAVGAGTGGALQMQLYPSAMVGSVNIYYRARPLLWGDTSNTSYTNLDTSVQEAAIYYAVGKVLVNRGRAMEWKQIWKDDYDQMIEDLKESVNRRVVPKSGRVRDVQDRSFPSSPWWLSG
jgi:hypothetical protein